MRTNETYDEMADLRKQVAMYEEENRALRTRIAMMEDERDALKHQARIGEATENFLTEIKRIMR